MISFVPQIDNKTSLYHQICLELQDKEMQKTLQIFTDQSAPYFPLFANRKQYVRIIMQQSTRHHVDKVKECYEAKLQKNRRKQEFQLPFPQIRGNQMACNICQKYTFDQYSEHIQDSQHLKNIPIQSMYDKTVDLVNRIHNDWQKETQKQLKMETKNEIFRQPFSLVESKKKSLPFSLIDSNIKNISQGKIEKTSIQTRTQKSIIQNEQQKLNENKVPIQQKQESIQKEKTQPSQKKRKHSQSKTQTSSLKKIKNNTMIEDKQVQKTPIDPQILQNISNITDPLQGLKDNVENFNKYVEKFLLNRIDPILHPNQ